MRKVISVRSVAYRGADQRKLEKNLARKALQKKIFTITS